MSPVSWSVPFNISAKSTACGSSTTTSSPASTSSAAPTAFDAASTTVASSSPSTSFSTSASSQDGMTTGVKLGFGLGIAGAAIVGFAVGWVASRKFQTTGGSPGPPMQTDKGVRELPAEYTSTHRGQDMMASPPYTGTTSTCTFPAPDQAFTSGVRGGDGRFSEAPAELDARYSFRSELR